MINLFQSVQKYIKTMTVAILNKIIRYYYLQT